MAEEFDVVTYDKEDAHER